MQDISGVRLDSLDREFGLAVDRNRADVIQLAALLRIEIRAVEDESDAAFGLLKANRILKGTLLQNGDYLA